MRYGGRDPRGVEVTGRRHGGGGGDDRRGARRRRRGGAERSRAAGRARHRPRRPRGDPRPRRGLRGRARRAVPAGELALLARVSDQPSPGIAGGNQRLAEALADAVGRERIDLGEPVWGIADEGDGVMVATERGSFGADRCVIAVPATVIDRIELRPALPEATDALASIVYGHAAKLFVPLPGPVAPSATLAVPDRYWAWTASGDEDGASQPVVNAFAGSAAALAGLGVEDGSAIWADAAHGAAPRPRNRSRPSGALDLGRRRVGRRRLLGRRPLTPPRPRSTAGTGGSPSPASISPAR